VFILTGVAGGLASRIWSDERKHGAKILEEANRVLSTLHHIARAIPGGLEMTSVASAAVAELRDSLRSPAGALLLEEAGVYRVLSSYGLSAPQRASVRPGVGGLSTVLTDGACIVRRDELIPATAEALGPYDCWLAAPLRRGDATLGLLVAACPDHEQHQHNRMFLQQVADESAVAVENARLFRNVRELSIDEERRRLAREMHDGIAQALTHVRLELDFMARHGVAGNPAVKGEVVRLTRVVDRAIADVRSMIVGLRSSVSPDGLAGSLRAYLRDLRGLGGPEIVFVSRGSVKLQPEIEAELFRIAQEAVSNAVQHAQGTVVTVTLTEVAGQVRLAVEDDGTGFRRESTREGGVGLHAMAERSERVGAKLVLHSTLGKGTTVEVSYDVPVETKMESDEPVADRVAAFEGGIA
jgi:signal transduction histidine kinase